MRDVGDKMAPHFLQPFKIGYVMKHNDDAALFPSIVVKWAKVGVEYILGKAFGSDFLMYFFIIFKYCCNVFSEIQVIIKICVILTDDVLVMLFQKSFHCGVDHDDFAFLV